MTPDRVQTSITGDRLERLIAKVDRLERDTVEEMETLLRLQKKISKQIESIQPENQKDVLFRRYCLFHKWERIASDMGVTVRYVHMLHGNALQTFARKFSKL